MNGGNRAAGAAGENQRAGFGNVARAARAIGGKGDVFSGFELVGQRHQAFNRSARRTSLRGAETEAFDDAAGPLAVEIYGVHDHHAAIAPDPGGGEDAAVPERADAGFTPLGNLNGVVDSHDFEADGGADQADDPVNRPGDDWNLHPAPAGKWRQWDFGRRICAWAAGWRGGFRVGFHCAIV